MTLWLRILIILAIGGSFAVATSFVCTNNSECFYLTVPVLSLAIFLTGISDVRAGLKTALRQVLLIVAVFLMLALSFASMFFGSPGWLPYLPWSFWLATSAAFYYFTAVVIVLFWLRRLLFWPGQVLHQRWNFTPALRVTLCQVVPFTLFILLALPLGLAFTNVHRFKLPNLSDPQQAQERPFEDVSFASADGTELRGWWIPARKPSSRTLIICHGVSANRTLFLPFTEAGDWLDANILMFDLRGHGDSGGHTVTLGCLEKDDALAAIAYVRRERSEQAHEVFGMGISLGAVTMAQAAAAAEPPLTAVILDSCFTSTREMTQAAVGAFPSWIHPLLLTLGLPLVDLHAGCAMMEVCPEATIDRLRAPVLFLHSRGDPLIPSQHSVRLHARAAEPKQLLVFDLDGHCDAFFARKERYRAAVQTLTSNPTAVAR